MKQLTSSGVEEPREVQPTPTSRPTPSELLTGDPEGAAEIGPHLWGFGGLHGGLALALAAREMRRGATGDLRSITGQFLRPTRHAFTIRAESVRRGRTVQVVNAAVHSGGKPAINATGTFGRATGPVAEPIGPCPADAGHPLDHEVFTPPVELVPISQFTQIRPVGPALPYTGGDHAELTAWIRLVDDDSPVDEPRLIMLADALAPSYSAILRDLLVVPTVELTVRPGAALATASSPWTLVRARSTSASRDGWINEHIDLWSPDGGHLGHAQQLRIVTRAR